MSRSFSFFLPTLCIHDHVQSHGNADASTTTNLLIPIVYSDASEYTDSADGQRCDGTCRALLLRLVLCHMTSLISSAPPCNNRHASDSIVPCPSLLIAKSF